MWVLVFNHLAELERTSCLNLIELLLSFASLYSLSLSRYAMGMSVVSDFGVF